jgi:hypothetical protein
MIARDRSKVKVWELNSRRCTDGSFLFSLLDAGRYRIEVTAEGFETLISEPITVRATEITDLRRLPLTLGGGSQNITVHADATLLQTTAALGKVFDARTAFRGDGGTETCDNVFTFSGPVEIPGQVLPVGTYVFARQIPRPVGTSCRSSAKTSVCHLFSGPRLPSSGPRKNNPYVRRAALRFAENCKLLTIGRPRGTFVTGNGFRSEASQEKI